jgi:hypothetical protein
LNLRILVKRMILTIPYYDPSGRYGEAVQQRFGMLKSVFSEICLSAISPTYENNADLMQRLEQQGCHIVKNLPGASVGSQSREALRLAASFGQPIFFGFLDRLLLALEVNWRDTFIRDVRACEDAGYRVFERSQSAWETHPGNYREIEQMVSRMFEWLWGEYIELMPCAFILSHTVAGSILSQSVSPGYEIWAEWMLLAMKEGIAITTKQVDWLPYQHPYWEGIAPEAMRREREQSQAETLKRIRMNMPVSSLMTEERFRNLKVIRQRCQD